MSRITTMDRTAAKAVREAVNAALANLQSTHGVAARLGTCRFDPYSGTASFKLDVSIVAPGEAPMSPDRAYLARNESMLTSFICVTDGISLVGRAVTIRGEAFIIDGYRARAHKNPWVLQRVSDGKRFVFPDLAVSYGFRVEAERAALREPRQTW